MARGSSVGFYPYQVSPAKDEACKSFLFAGSSLSTVYVVKIELVRMTESGGPNK